MICKPCADAADGAKRDPVSGQVTFKVLHPKKCGCDCQHKPPGTRQQV